MGKCGLTNIPTMNVKESSTSQMLAYGSNNYVTTVDGTSYGSYQEYLTLLEDYGFTKVAENKEGLGKTVYAATFAREDLVLTVAFYALQKKTSISFYEGAVPEHLVWRDSYVSGNTPGKKTRIHMKELWMSGNSFIFQLKNSHFVISAGDHEEDLPYLLDYLRWNLLQ